ncbi:type I DNA topoisomerase [Luteimonas soli]|uniref:DNA topoisomerase 1 n=1 Tax=Luteimonas soli TaxID=1648966 RepID=A0ABV7XIQ2_9GAMM
MTTLLIVESPGKVKKLASILGPGFRIMPSVGHVRDLPEKEMGVAPPDFVPHYVPTEKGRNVLAGLLTEVPKVDRVLLATDPDREGEAIAWHLADALGLRNPQRITFGEITETAVRAAVQSPRGLDMPLVRAQEARRVLDRLVGYRVSPALSDRAGQRLAAGRVQSPAVRLVVDREREIRAFRQTEHYGAELLFDGAEGRQWKATWQTKPHLQVGQDYILDDALAARVAAVRHVTVAGFEDSETRKGPPAPFTTVALQKVAGARLGFKPKQTMDLAQKLYEAGLISYHRTDKPNLSDDAVQDIAAIAAADGLPLSEKRRTWKSKEGAQEGHEAIRPTHMADRDAGETPEQRALYRLIWTRAYASQLTDARYAVRTAVLEGDAAGLPVSFLARGRTLTHKGWLALQAPDEDDAGDEDQANNPVPELATGASCSAIDGKILTLHTKAPPRYKQSTLVAELENRGIGRPSTYAAIMDNITARSYIIEGEKDFLFPTAAGEAIRDALVGTFQFVDLDYTRELEEQLDHVAGGSLSYEHVVSRAYAQLDQELSTLQSGAAIRIEDPNAPKCPVCSQGTLHRRKGSKGFFWGCSRWKDGCKAIFDDNRGKPAFGGKEATHCPVCKKGVLRQRSGANGKFWGCSRYPDCKGTVPDKRGRPDLAAASAPRKPK